MRKVLVVFNPKSGHAEQALEIRPVIERHFTPPEWSLQLYQINGNDDVAAICREACGQDTSLVISAGGDGTVVAVANGLVHTKVPLGILPLGTGNDLARALNIPLDLEKAIALLIGDHDIAEVDALKVGNRYFFSNVSVGISPEMMSDTTPALKKRFGLLAYVWTMLKRSSIFRLHRYTLTIDGRRWRVRATEVLISNTTLLERPPYVFGPPETLCDGRLEIYLITAHTLGEYLRLAWDVIRHPGQSTATLHHWAAQRKIRIETGRHPRLVQADGEVIGRTPVDVELEPRALRVIRPKPAPVAQANGVLAPTARAIADDLVSARSAGSGTG